MNIMMSSRRCSLYILSKLQRHQTTNNKFKTVFRSYSNLSPIVTNRAPAWAVKQQTRSVRWELCGVLQARCQSTETAATEATNATTQIASNLPPGYIPEPPALPTEQVTETALNALGEVPLSALGLCNYTPPGFIQWGLENLHVGLDIPWWGAIAMGTLIIRMCLFPIVIRSQRSNIHMANHMPTMLKLQGKMTKAKAEGNMMKVMETAYELQEYMARNEIKYSRQFQAMLIQAPIFVSMLIALRGMTNLPVESMQSGGLFWFTDLTVMDPYHILPIVSCATFLATIEIGADGMRAQDMKHFAKWILRLMPIFMLPFIWKFPAALCGYFFCTNLFSLAQVSILKIKAVRKYLKIPKYVKHEGAASQTKKGFVEGFTDSYNNVKMMNRIQNRKQADALAFEKAGQAPVKKTYAKNPKTVQKKQALKN